MFLKCESRVNNEAPRSMAAAAIYRSFEGIGRPFFRSPAQRLRTE